MASPNGTVYVWNVAGQNSVEVSRILVPEVCFVAFVDDGAVLTAVPEMATIRDISTGNVVSQFEIPCACWAAAISHDRATFAVATSDGVGLWDVATGKRKAFLEIH